MAQTMTDRFDCPRCGRSTGPIHRCRGMSRREQITRAMLAHKQETTTAMDTTEIANRIDALAEKYNERRAQYWASVEDHKERGAKASAKVDRKMNFEVAYTQEMRAAEAKAAYMDLTALSVDLHAAETGPVDTRQSVSSWAVVNLDTDEVMLLTDSRQAAINRASALYAASKTNVGARRVTLRVEAVAEVEYR